jgi:hypothetical protein
VLVAIDKRLLEMRSKYYCIILTVLRESGLQYDIIMIITKVKS